MAILLLEIAVYIYVCLKPLVWTRVIFEVTDRELSGMVLGQLPEPQYELNESGCGQIHQIK